MTVLLKTPFNAWKLVDLKLTKGVLNTVLSGEFECWDLRPGVTIVYNPLGAARGMPYSCRCRKKDMIFFGNVLVVGTDRKTGKLTNAPEWVIQFYKDWSAA